MDEEGKVVSWYDCDVIIQAKQLNLLFLLYGQIKITKMGRVLVWGSSNLDSQLFLRTILRRKLFDQVLRRKLLKQVDRKKN